MPGPAWQKGVIRMSEFIPEDLFVGEPVLTMRWRLHNRALPLKNRHLRAFTQAGVSNGLASWARQHIEWTLAEGSGDHPDGVLSLAVDDQGRAVMATEAYEPLPPLTVRGLCDRVRAAGERPVEGEVVWIAREGGFDALTSAGKPLSGANSLVADLAKTLGRAVSFAPRGLGDDLALSDGDEVLLVSDEHGVVGAADASGSLAAQFQAYYERLVMMAKPDDFDRANLGMF